MKYPHLFINADLGLFIVLGVFLLVGLYNGTKLGYIQKKYIPMIIAGVIVIAVFLFVR